MDTLKAAQDLRASGFQQAQAEAMAHAMAGLLREALQPVHKEFDLVRKEIELIRKELVIHRWLFGLLAALLVILKVF